MAKTLNPTSIAVTINGKDYSKYVMFPFKVSNLLDEQLDEASLTLIGVSDKNFKSLTDVIVTLTNDNKEKSYYMLVASDKADEIPTGSGKYKHELYLIEQTKYLECFIVRSIGYLNPLEKSYVQIPTIPDGSTTSVAYPDKSNAGLNDVFNPYLTPQVGSIYVYGLRTDTTVNENSPNYNKGLVLRNGAYGGNGSRIWYAVHDYDDYDAEDRFIAPMLWQYPSIKVIDSNNNIVYARYADYIGSGDAGDADATIPYWIFDLAPLNKDVKILNIPSGLYTVVYQKCAIMHDYESDNGTGRVFFNARYYIVVL